ncbi:hypothetical protein [Sagittula salina]|uniref:Uncharacterized protein n=1 Tax=Sagittula salina TaxID=2820268 RepID=A0A940MM41_9RHOB|nr:hypothetical protein [Sagittula salina]MBP0484016.1 hypothetical protein [Sagittula salina]
MLNEMEAMSITTFRENVAERLRKVEETGVQLWLKRRGRLGCAVVPFYQVKVLDALLGRSVEEVVRGMQSEARLWQAAKRIQAAEERARLLRGEGIGGATRTRLVARMLEEGYDPWERDAVLRRSR